MNSKKNIKDGEFKKYYRSPTGKTPKEFGSYKDGLLHGKWQDFYKNGKVRTLGNYEEGKPSGTWETFDTTGIKVRENTYKDGKEPKIIRQKGCPPDRDTHHKNSKHRKKH